MITDDELARLRVPLASLPGFDPVGLEIYGLGQCLYVVEPDLRVAVWSHGQALHHAQHFCELDLADASTADRVARRLAGRVGLPVTCGVRWVPLVPIGGRGSWSLYGDAGSVGFGLGRGGDVAVLANLDPADDRRLPDGSRYVDRLALALVAIHVGSTP